MEMKAFGYIAAVCAVAAVIAVAAWAMYEPPDEEEDGTFNEAHFISFYFYDNFENDQTSGLLSENKHLAAGYWVKGYGGTKTECFLDACDAAGLDAKIAGGNILSIGAADDGNFCVMGWADNAWTLNINLASSESYQVRYMAVGHGRWTNGINGTPPSPYQTPDDILWYAGADLSDSGSIYVYFYDNYENDEFVDQIYPYSSVLNAFIADGYWASAAAGDAVTVLTEACAKAFGANTTIDIDPSGNITRIGGIANVLHIMFWNGSAWEPCTVYGPDIQPGLCIAVGHGYPAGGPPAPWEGPSDRKWCI